MTKEIRLLITTIITALFLSCFAINEAAAFATGYEPAPGTGIWTAAEEGSGITGLDSSLAGWGEPTESNKKSDLRFTGSSGGTFDEGEVSLCCDSLAWGAGPQAAAATVTGGGDGGQVRDAAPKIEVEKSVWNGQWFDANDPTGPSLGADEDVMFRFAVKNTGNVTLTNVTLVDDQIEDLFINTGLSTPCPENVSLAQNGLLICYGKLAWAPGQHKNTAEVTASYGNLDVHDSDSAHYFGLSPSIDVEKEVRDRSGWLDADTEPGPYLSETDEPRPLFRLTVTNDGSFPLENVSLGDDQLSKLFSDEALTKGCTVPNPLNPGGSFTCYGDVAWAPGQHANEATASGSYQGDRFEDTDQAHYFGSDPKIEVVKSVKAGAGWEDANVGPGPELWSAPIFQFIVTNTGNVPLSDIHLVDSAIAALYMDEAGTTVCADVAQLNPTGTFTCYGRLAWAAGQHQNAATVTAMAQDDIPVSDTDLAHYFGPNPDIDVEKLIWDGSAWLDMDSGTGPILDSSADPVFQFNVRNIGNVTLTNVSLVDSFISTFYSEQDLQTHCALPDPFGVGDSFTCYGGLAWAAGQHENEVTVSGDFNGITAEDSDLAHYFGASPDIRLTKTAEPEAYTRVGEVIAYEFVVQNTGNVPLKNVTITDPLAGLSSLSCSAALPAALPAGESITCTATYEIDQDDLDSGQIENTAVATGMDDDSQTVDDDADARIEGPKEEASIHLDKRAEPAAYHAVGDEIVYTFTVANNGIYTLHDVTVTDLPLSLGYGPIETLKPGESKTYQYTYTITRADLDARNIYNAATAVGHDPEGEPVSSTDDALVERTESKKVNSLPATGFAPGRITALPPQSVDKAYTAYSDFWLEIPKLGVRVDIVGVPRSNDGWDVTWLDDAAGWLTGTTFPTWPGNSVVTAHVWDAFDQAGPFVDLNELQWGDKVIVHLNGSAYVFEVRSRHTVQPDDLRLVEREEGYAWLNLLTCRGFDEEREAYQYRLIVRAVLVDVE